MATTSTRRRGGQTASPISAYSLLLDYERTLANTVEATIAAGLDAAAAPPPVREQVIAAWRDPLTMIAAEALSERLGDQADRLDLPHAQQAMLHRVMEPYAALISAAAESERRRLGGGFMAAD